MLTPYPRLLLGLSLGVLLACSSKPPPPLAAPPAQLTAEAKTALSALRAKLDQVRSAADDLSLVTGGQDPVDYMLSLNRDQVRDALGEAHVCGAADVRGVDGRGKPFAPCEAENDWYYSFYHLPRGAVGGGPDLLVHFDESGRCVRAGWRMSQ